MLRKILSLSLVAAMLLANPGWARETRTEEVYTIKKGDTLWHIAGEFLGDPFKWPGLWKYNGNRYIRNPHWIYPGNPVIIPQDKKKVSQIDILREEISWLKADLEGFKEGVVRKFEEAPSKEEVSSLEEAKRLGRRVENVEATLLSYDALLKRFDLERLDQKVAGLEDTLSAIKKRMAVNEIAAQQDYRKIENEISQIGQTICLVKEIVVKEEAKEKKRPERKATKEGIASYALIGLAFAGAVALAAN